MKTLKDLLDSGIKPAIEVLFTALQKMFTQRREEILDQRMQVLGNIQTEAMYLIVDQLTKNNTRLQMQVVDLTREVRSTVATKTTPTWIPTTTATTLLLISDLDVASAAANR